jgi:hypothetical protein
MMRARRGSCQSPTAGAPPRLRRYTEGTETDRWLRAAAHSVVLWCIGLPAPVLAGEGGAAPANHEINAGMAAARPSTRATHQQHPEDFFSVVPWCCWCCWCCRRRRRHGCGPCAAGCEAPGRSRGARRPEGAAAVASCLAAVSTEIYQCDVCYCQEILRRNGRGQVWPGHHAFLGLPPGWTNHTCWQNALPCACGERHGPPSSTDKHAPRPTDNSAPRVPCRSAILDFVGRGVWPEGVERPRGGAVPRPRPMVPGAAATAAALERVRMMHTVQQRVMSFVVDLLFEYVRACCHCCS